MTITARRQAVRVAGWLCVLALIELVTRVLVYALSPSPLALAEHLRGELGGPGPVAVTLVAMGLAIVISAAMVWLAALGVHERWVLEPRSRRADEPVLAVRPLLLRATGLWIASMLVFAGVESYIHYRAGLGFHGLSCLVGPVHRNAIPVTGAVSLIAAAALAAAAHVLRWMRRTIARVTRPAPPAPRLRHVSSIRPTRTAPAPSAPRTLGARGPPLVGV